MIVNIKFAPAAWPIDCYHYGFINVSLLGSIILGVHCGFFMGLHLIYFGVPIFWSKLCAHSGGPLWSRYKETIMGFVMCVHDGFVLGFYSRFIMEVQSYTGSGGAPCENLFCVA